MLTLDIDITKINRVGEATAKKMKKLGVEAVKDLLFYFPFRYDDFSKITPIAELKSGASANVVGQIELIQNKRSRRRRMYITEAIVSDETESVKVIWFNQPFIGRNLRVGDWVSLAGKVEEDFGGPVMMAPVYEKVNAEKSPLPPLMQRGQDLTPTLSLVRRGSNAAIHTQGLVPNYHLTANLTHKQVRFLIKQVIHSTKQIIDWMPIEIKNKWKLLNLSDAIQKIHFPASQDDVTAAKKRLAFDELFLIQLQSQIIRRDARFCVSTPIKFFENETKKFVESLPFKLTNAQRKAAWEILRDIGKDKPMARLLEGDVGSGKTVVALIAMFNVALNGGQAVLMAPTEILARQHFDSIKKLLKKNIPLALLTRSQFLISNFEFLNKSQIPNPKITKKDILENIKNGNIKIIIGTHALLQENVEFPDLALAVIDEQHRFGVEQRKALTEKTRPHPNPLFSKEMKVVPHLLSMTATPIPRSLALALYGDLDLSIINEMPADRKKIITRVVSEEKREAAYEFMRKQVKEGRQVFVICPLIDISDKLGVKSVKEEFEKLDKFVFPEIKMGMLHGRLKSMEKEKIMSEFLENKIKILVSTSVVEVGVDVPNATIMMIEGADHFGLAQLHQFRGRVGRAGHQSYCFLLAESDASSTLERLNALTRHNDGMTLAKIDLKFRGPGEVYGTLQKGFPELKIASLFDYELMKEAKEAAEKIIGLGLGKWPMIKDKLGEFEKKIHLE
ncbi:ATP-dependent DNA helicase RecG [Candidatus Falkowbacteria bacterium]|nr:ATP-dependent DNA helicase RecG [Candidatus Falkowbacteria bacterium]